MLLTTKADPEGLGLLDFLCRHDVEMEHDPVLLRVAQAYAEARKALCDGEISVEDYVGWCLEMIRTIRSQPVGECLIEIYGRLFMNNY